MSNILALDALPYSSEIVLVDGLAYTQKITFGGSGNSGSNKKIIALGDAQEPLLSCARVCVQGK